MTTTAVKLPTKEEIVNYIFEYSKLSSIEILGFSAHHHMHNQQYKFFFAIKPEIRVVNYTFSEIVGTEWDKLFSLPFPWRYGVITVTVQSYTDGSASVSAQFPNLSYAPYKLHGKRILKLEEMLQMGSFLSNSYPWKERGTTFCQAYYYHASYSPQKPYDHTSVAVALAKILENYYWSQYNNHWYQQCFPSPSIYALIRDLCCDVTFNSTQFSKLQSLAVGSGYTNVDQYLASPYWEYVRQFNAINNHASERVVFDYYSVLSQLEANPEYWNGFGPGSVPASHIPDSKAYLDGIVQRGSKSQNEFIAAITKGI